MQIDSRGCHVDESFIDCSGGFEVELQKNNALFSLKGVIVGMKLKLQSFEIAIAVLRKSVLCSVQSHITTWSQIVGCVLSAVL